MLRICFSKKVGKRRNSNGKRRKGSSFLKLSGFMAKAVRKFKKCCLIERLDRSMLFEELSSKILRKCLIVDTKMLT